jgi:hypothetical protein
VIRDILKVDKQAHGNTNQARMKKGIEHGLATDVANPRIEKHVAQICNNVVERLVHVRFLEQSMDYVIRTDIKSH